MQSPSSSSIVVQHMIGFYVLLEQLTDNDEAIKTFDNKVKTGIVNVFESRYEELKNANRQSATHSLCSSGAGGTRTLENFDWSARLVLSSQSMARMYDPRVVLRLDTREPHEGTAESKNIELDYDSLKRLVNECDDIMESM
eukprot:gb/GECG01002819.1/.p1 GENE.gb/GECG01002819.1/~~gb/GECG01002819.1/.p1  ORF type:complete len:141 (+),score=17.25 gb/GECG01002819.1/:1-423(+)